MSQEEIDAEPEAIWDALEFYTSFLTDGEVSSAGGLSEKAITPGLRPEKDPLLDISSPPPSPRPRKASSPQKPKRSEKSLVSPNVQPPSPRDMQQPKPQAFQAQGNVC
jgi:hypothetical protein